MKRRRFLSWSCAHCALLASWQAQAQAQTPMRIPGNDQWQVPERFAAPELATDEGGLWATMTREEQRLRRSPFLIRDDALRTYLQDVACRLGGAHCADIRVYAIRSAWFNAVMAPNGMMQVWSGLLLRMDNEAQLAAVIGHEIGHFMQRHSLQRLRDAKDRSALAVVLAPFGLIGAVGQLALLANQFVYSRDQEREADAIGLGLMRQAGYDTAEAAKVWGNLLAELKARPNADASKSSVLFASHPPSEEREATLAQLASGGSETGAQTYRQHTQRWQFDLMEDELKRGQYEETLALLNRKLTTDGGRVDLLYFRGETRRLRAQDGDLDRALSDLTVAAARDDAPPQTYRALGLLAQTRRDAVGAASAFERYLQLAPQATDAGLIQAYLSELKS